jgi:hypothetical protein
VVYLLREEVVTRMSEQPVSGTELTTAAIVAVLSGVVTWYSSSLNGIQGATNAAIAVVVTLVFFFIGVLVLRWRSPSWYSPQ